MVRKPRPIAQALLPGGLLARIALAGGYSAVAALWLMIAHDGDLDHTRWLAFTALVCAQAVRAYANRSLHEPLHRLTWNPVLLAACIVTVAVQALIPMVPPIADAFRATPLDAVDWLLVGVIALAPVVLAESIRTLRRGPWVA
jgi:hypothetical protein